MANICSFKIVHFLIVVSFASSAALKGVSFPSPMSCLDCKMIYVKCIHSSLQYVQWCVHQVALNRTSRSFASVVDMWILI
ncbi:hypothetical protein KY290_030911 [Solanum tuberosum]|uniref:Secreted protein n=1 Tax=Solanum tuberosum TaxID=4113 RepID=A0ABQ7U800_SOLTU|nr:hypothetical protein KY285_029992 [Solanum tuberosum]KAH0742918.1 hypothetical protein KY290_030911 [Solanum tuberosum]